MGKYLAAIFYGVVMDKEARRKQKQIRRKQKRLEREQRRMAQELREREAQRQKEIDKTLPEPPPRAFMEKAFVIGNGKTRLDINLELLRGKGRTYGCNYLYEEFIPDVLVAVDLAISTHIEKSGYAENHTFYTRNPGKHFGKNSGAHRIKKNHAYSSGQVALTLACEDNSRYIYMIGMDLMGNGKINDAKNKRKFNNVYADRQFYKSSNADETYFGNWITQVVSIMNEHPDKKFIRVNPHLDYSPPEWTNCRNYTTMPLEHFLKMINT